MLVDGRQTPDVDLCCEAVVKGDATSAGIAAALVARSARAGELPKQPADRRQVMVVVLRHEEPEIDDRHRLFEARVQGGHLPAKFHPVAELQDWYFAADEQRPLQRTAALQPRPSYLEGFLISS